jgi:prepilin-type N-terminal cleavage/methylation domain-containing protein
MKIFNIRLKSIGGFTLMELMTTVVVVGIVAAAATPSFIRTSKRIKFRGETKNLVSVLRTARSNAISEKAPYGVYFDNNELNIKMFKDLANLSSYSYDAGSDSLVSVDTLPSEIAYVNATFSTGAVIFKPNGTASATGDVYLMSDNLTCVSISRINVLASTGRSKVVFINNYN